MGSPNVTLYVTGWCPYCTRARALLDRKGVVYTAIDIESAAGLQVQHLRGGHRRPVGQGAALDADPHQCAAV